MKKPGFYVQLHLHTAETSRCGRAGGAEMARACKEAGYDLIAITDHFMNANIGCGRELPWEQKVEYLFRGYYAAKKEGEKIGLHVLRGWETFTEGPELLTYGWARNFSWRIRTSTGLRMRSISGWSTRRAERSSMRIRIARRRTSRYLCPTRILSRRTRCTTRATQTPSGIGRRIGRRKDMVC